jgi:hypothetical protein
MGGRSVQLLLVQKRVAIWPPPVPLPCRTRRPRRSQLRRRSNAEREAKNVALRTRSSQHLYDAGSEARSLITPAPEKFVWMNRQFVERSCRQSSRKCYSWCNKSPKNVVCGVRTFVCLGATAMPTQGMVTRRAAALSKASQGVKRQ